MPRLLLLLSLISSAVLAQGYQPGGGSASNSASSGWPSPANYDGTNVLVFVDAGVSAKGLIQVNGVARNDAGIETPTMSLICFDGNACLNKAWFDGSNMNWTTSGVTSFRQEVDIIGTPALRVGPFATTEVDIAGSASATGTITSSGALNVITGGGALLANNGDAIPGVHATQTGAQVSMEFGACTLTTGACTVTFATAFSAAPKCVCSENGTTVTAGCAIGTPTTTQLVVTTLTTATVADWLCIGAR